VQTPGVQETLLGGHLAMSAAEFAWIASYIYDVAGIQLKDGKQAMVAGRLDRRVRHFGLDSYGQYFDLLARPDHADEAVLAVDLLTTNETYFFREPQHFDLLPRLLPVRPGRPVRVWSAASSTGEEAYTIALTLAGVLGQAAWEIVGTDISTRVLETARRALYPLEAAERIPEQLRRTYCLRGTGRYEGFMTLQTDLRRRVQFQHANLTKPLPELGLFDVVFLRNVMIYFDQETKQQLARRIARLVRPGGHLLIGHAESLNGLDVPFRLVSPSVYRLPEAAGGR
jgi:chemotaxis protein methyltransferase CheR